ncbi:hypothetical protein GEMRC1_002357 [Eukaryota sp. GEM-RC1]
MSTNSIQHQYVLAENADVELTSDPGSHPSINMLKTSLGKEVPPSEKESKPSTLPLSEDKQDENVLLSPDDKSVPLARKSSRLNDKSVPPVRKSPKLNDKSVPPVRKPKSVPPVRKTKSVPSKKTSSKKSKLKVTYLPNGIKTSDPDDTRTPDPNKKSYVNDKNFNRTGIALNPKELYENRELHTKLLIERYGDINAELIRLGKEQAEQNKSASEDDLSLSPPPCIISRQDPPKRRHFTQQRFPSYPNSRHREFQSPRGTTPEREQ